MGFFNYLGNFFSSGIQNETETPLKLPSPDLYATPPTSSANDWITYFDSERTRLLAADGDYEISDLTALAFKSLAGRENEFFELRPTAEEVKSALELPIGYDEYVVTHTLYYPARWVKSIGAIALRGVSSLTDWRIIADFTVPARLEWEDLKRDLLGRAMIDGIEVRLPGCSTELTPYRFR